MQATLIDWIAYIVLCGVAGSLFASGSKIEGALIIFCGFVLYLI